MSSQLALGAGCAADATGSGSPNSAPSSAGEHVGYDGRTLFQAVFFNSGRAAEKTRGLWGDERSSYVTKQTPEELAASLERSADMMEAEHVAEAKAAYVREVAARVRAEKLTANDLSQSSERATAISEALLAQIDAVDPSFFAAFADHMQSGDPRRVQIGLAEGGERLLAANTSFITLPPSSTIGSLPGTTIGSVPSKQPTAPGIPGSHNGEEIVVAVDADRTIETMILDYHAMVLGRPQQGGGVTVQTSPLQRDEVTSALARAFAL